jgi:hypothetical protein
LHEVLFSPPCFPIQSIAAGADAIEFRMKKSFGGLRAHAGGTIGMRARA